MKTLKQLSIITLIIMGLLSVFIGVMSFYLFKNEIKLEDFSKSVIEDHRSAVVE